MARNLMHDHRVSALRAAAFYEGNGFVRLPDSPRLVLPMHTIRQLIEP